MCIGITRDTEEWANASFFLSFLEPDTLKDQNLRQAGRPQCKAKGQVHQVPRRPEKTERGSLPTL